MIGKRILILFIAAMLLVLTACGGKHQIESSETSEESISSGMDSSKGISSAPFSGLSGLGAGNYPRIDGSTANMPLMAKLYSEVCGVSLEDAETMIQASGGTGAVWRNMMYEGADLLLVYEAPENIKAEMEEKGLLDQLEITPIGRDGLVFLVNSQNPVDSLTREQLTGIYTGAVKDWSDVGGEGGHIAAFQRNQESGSQTLFLSLLMQQIEPMAPPSELRPAGMGALIDAVAEYDGSGGAIGFSVYYYANLMYENPNLKLLAVDGVPPSAQSIGNGSYPLVNDFYVVIRKSEPESSPARILRDWLLTDEGRQLLINTNYVTINADSEKSEALQNPPQSAEEVLEGIIGNPTPDDFQGEDFFIYDQIVCINAADIDWVNELDLIEGDYLGEIKRTGITDHYMDWDATHLPPGTKIYQHAERHEVLVAVNGDSKVLYMKMIEG